MTLFGRTKCSVFLWFERLFVQTFCDKINLWNAWENFRVPRHDCRLILLPTKRRKALRKQNKRIVCIHQELNKIWGEKLLQVPRVTSI